jgi:hypothetical protein
MLKPKDITPVFKGVVKEGKIIFNDPFSINHWLIKLEGKVISIKVKRWAEKRTNAQNRFLWLYYRIISDELSGGETPPEWYHEYFKRIYVDAQMIDVMGKTIRIPGSTTELSKYQFSKLLLNIEKETGVPIPDPKLFGHMEDIYTRKT